MHTVEFDRLDLGPDARVLDLGCGEGRHANGLAYHVAERDGESIDVVGVDLDAARLESARSDGVVGDGDGIDDPEFYRGDATALPFADDSFDAAVCAEVLEHLPAYGDALDELDRVLAPGGTLAVSVPRYGPERVCWALSDAYHEVEGGHVRIFRRSELRGAIESRGFDHLDTHHAHALHAPYWWLKCLWWDREPDPTPLRAYERFLEWDVVANPEPIDALETRLNPILGKSLVLYFRNDDPSA